LSLNIPNWSKYFRVECQSIRDFYDYTITDHIHWLLPYERCGARGWPCRNSLLKPIRFLPLIISSCTQMKT